MEVMVGPTVAQCEYGNESFIWSDEIVVDAWQKDGYNHYTVRCPECQKESEVKVEIENVDERNESFLCSDINKCFYQHLLNQ